MAKPRRPFPEPIQKDYDWAFRNYGKLAKQYPEQWIAFVNRHVLAAGPNLMRVLTKARQQVDQPHVPHLFVERGIHVYAFDP